jgi:hypothetical protein
LQVRNKADQQFLFINVDHDPFRFVDGYLVLLLKDSSHRLSLVSPHLCHSVSITEGLLALHHRASVVSATLGSGKLSMNHLKNGYNVFTCWLLDSVRGVNELHLLNRQSNNSCTVKSWLTVSDPHPRAAKTV